MRQSSEAAYSEFATSAWPRLYRTAVVIVGDRQLAEDLVQAALVKAYLAWPRLRDAGKAHAFTRRVMVNVAHDWFRKRSWTEQAGDAEPDDHAADHSVALVEKAALTEALRTLPMGQRSVVALRFLEDMSVHETADLLHVTSGTVKSQTSAALAALRQHAHLVHTRPCEQGAHHD